MKVDLDDLKFQMAVLEDAPTVDQWKLCNTMVNVVVAHDIAIFERTSSFMTNHMITLLRVASELMECVE